MVSLPMDHRSEKEFRKHSSQDRMVMRPARARRTTRAFTIGASVVALLYLMWSFLGAGIQRGEWRAERLGDEDKKEVVVTEKDLVPLEAHIMSKCPDAQDCLKMLVLPAMQRVHDKVNFTLSYIGTPTDNDGVDCMHGPAECMGNIIELCAASLYPDPKIYLGFTMCLTRDYQEIPERTLVEDCALEHGIDFASLDECAVRDDGGFGVGMLRDSVRRSTQAGVTKSCTVRLNEEIYCIRDGRQWKDCPGGSGVNDLVIAVEKLYRA